MKSEKAETIRRARNGDLEAFRLIHEEYGRRILNFIYRMLDSKEDAEDLTQNVFLQAFNELGRLQNVDRFESWLYRIARNEVYQLFRRRRGEATPYEPMLSTQEGEHPNNNDVRDERPTPQDNVLNNELGEAIRSVLSSLPAKLREVFVLSVIHERSYSEISDIVGRSLLSVKTDIFRARSHARKVLGKYLEVQR